MGNKKLKKILAGIGLAGLVGGVGLAGPAISTASG